MFECKCACSSCVPCCEIIGFCIYDDADHNDCNDDENRDDDGVDDENDFEEEGEEKEEEEEYTRISECVGFSCRRL